MGDKQYELALSNCASEPIHIPGRIQSFGGLLAFDIQNWEITHVSANLPAIVKEAINVGDDFASLECGKELRHDVRGVLGYPSIKLQRERLGIVEFGASSVDVAVHITNQIAVIELERATENPEDSNRAISQIRSLLRTLPRGQNLNGTLQAACQSIRYLTGYDRVMAYMFLDGGDGEVIAEVHSPSQSPFKGLRYPASDIPEQVRKSMVEMPFRIIADTNDAESEIFGQDRNKPLDLTRSHLKGVSPIHVEYLRNMGVQSTMNLPIVCRGNLWGLLAFHHARPRLLPPAMRGVCELFGQLLSMEVQRIVEDETINHRRRGESLCRSLKVTPTVQSSLDGLVEEYSGSLCNLLDADGVTIVHGDEAASSGVVLEKEETLKLLCSVEQDTFITCRLSNWFDPADVTSGKIYRLSPTGDEVAGVLAIRFTSDETNGLVFFRRAEESRVHWAGMPDKRVEFGPNGPRLHPRASFAEYIETVRDCSRPWRPSEVACAQDLRHALIERLFRDSSIARQLWQRQKEFQDTLIAELNHRVKNILTLVRSIARQTGNNSSSLTQYIEGFEKRITALATAHDLIGGNGTQWVSLRSLLNTELRPFLNEERQIQLNGPDVWLRSDAAPVMALVIHELTTNANKYGAMLKNSGKLDIHWRKRFGGLDIVWSESCETIPEQIGVDGFGMSLIQKAIPHECEGEADVHFGSHGLRATFWLPSPRISFESREIISESIANESVPFETNAAKEISGIQLQSVLVLEDNHIIAKEMETNLFNLGFGEVELAGNKTAALRLLANRSFDLALLDYNLGQSESSFEVAEVLGTVLTPIVFATGYGNVVKVPKSVKRFRCLTKPVSQDDLENAIRDLFNDETATST